MRVFFVNDSVRLRVSNGSAGHPVVAWQPTQMGKAYAEEILDECTHIRAQRYCLDYRGNVLPRALVEDLALITPDNVAVCRDQSVLLVQISVGNSLDKGMQALSSSLQRNGNHVECGIVSSLEFWRSLALLEANSLVANTVEWISGQIESDNLVLP